MLARSEAIKRNQPVILCKSSTGTSCTEDSEWEQGWLVFADGDNDGDFDATETVITVKNALHVGDTLRADNTIGDFTDQVAYATDGSASGSGVFVLCNADADLGNAREIDIAVTGRPTLQLTSLDCTP